jgi:hypothetical protein
MDQNSFLEHECALRLKFWLKPQLQSPCSETAEFVRHYGAQIAGRNALRAARLSDYCYHTASSKRRQSGAVDFYLLLVRNGIPVARAA